MNCLNNVQHHIRTVLLIFQNSRSISTIPDHISLALKFCERIKDPVCMRNFHRWVLCPSFCLRRFSCFHFFFISAVYQVTNRFWLVLSNEFPERSKNSLVHPPGMNFTIAAVTLHRIKLTDNNIANPFVSVPSRFLSVCLSTNAFLVRRNPVYPSKRVEHVQNLKPSRC